MYRDWRECKKGKKKSFLTRIKNHQGFTLIEVLIIVGIIIILTGMALVYLRNASNKAKVNKTKVEIEMMGRAIEQIEEDTENYLGSLDQLDDPTSPDESLSPWWGPYVSSLPVNIKDPWGTTYVYVYWVPQEDGGREFHYPSAPPGWSSSGERVGWLGRSLPPGLWKKLVGEGEGDLPDNGFFILSFGPDGEEETEDDTVYGTY